MNWGPWMLFPFEKFAAYGVIAGGTPAQFEQRTFFGLLKKVVTGTWPTTLSKTTRMVRFLANSEAYVAIRTEMQKPEYRS